jgi:hypothetical protein
MNLAERSSQLTPGQALLGAIIALVCLFALIYIVGGGDE